MKQAILALVLVGFMCTTNVATATQVTQESSAYSLMTNNFDLLPGKNRIGLTEFYPNPANTVVNADYSFPMHVRTARIVVSNVLGSKIEEIELSRTDRQVSINTSDYSGGVYILTLYVDGVSELSKRLVVKH